MWAIGAHSRGLMLNMIQERKREREREREKVCHVRVRNLDKTSKNELIK